MSVAVRQTVFSINPITIPQICTSVRQIRIFVSGIQPGYRTQLPRRSKLLNGKGTKRNTVLETTSKICTWTFRFSKRRHTEKQMFRLLPGNTVASLDFSTCRNSQKRSSCSSLILSVKSSSMNCSVWETLPRALQICSDSSFILIYSSLLFMKCIIYVLSRSAKSFAARWNEKWTNLWHAKLKNKWKFWTQQDISIYSNGSYQDIWMKLYKTFCHC